MKFFGKRQQQSEGLQKIPFQQKQAGGQSEPTDCYEIGFESGFMQGKLEGRKEGSTEGREQGVKQGIEQERARCLAVQEQIEAIGYLIDPKASATLLNGLISSGAITKIAGQQIIGLLSASQQQAEITSTVSPLSTGEVNPVLAEAKKRAQAAQDKKATPLIDGK